MIILATIYFLIERIKYFLIYLKKDESSLIRIAQHHLNDKVASKAMNKLRKDFDDSYFWCWDCDGLVCKQKDCCLQQSKFKK